MQHITLLDKNFRIFIPGEEIQKEIQRIADQMNADLEGEEVVCVGVLNGAFMFASDLLRRIRFDVRITFVKLASYQGISSSGRVKKLIGINEVLQDKTVVIVEDIIDTGNTIESMIDQVLGFKPKKVIVASLLMKPDLYTKNIRPDYIGFRIPPSFVVGYGLDYMGLGRNLPDLYVLED
jgi:hypoxanthine phosphoribosyltransferase